MTRGARYAAQRRRRADRRRAVRAAYDDASCSPTLDGGRAIVSLSRRLVIARGGTANAAWWAAWSALFPGLALARSRPRG